MKKLLLTLLLLFSLGMAAQAQVTFDFVNETYGMTRLSGTTQDYNPTSVTVSSEPVSIVINGKTRLWADGVRFYKDSSFTVNVADFDITKIELLDKNGAAITSNFRLDNGSTGSFNSGVWTGSANSVKINCTVSKGNAAISKLIVTYKSDDNRQEVALAWNPEAVSIDLEDEFVAPTLNATVDGVENAAAKAAVVYSSSNENLLKVAADGTFTLTPNVAGKATITASIPEDNETFKATEAATFKLTVVDPDAVDPIYEWKLVTNAAQLEAGDLLIIASESVAAGNKESSNNRLGIDVTVEKDILTYSETETNQPLILELGGSEGNWTFKTTNYKGTNGFLKNANTTTDKNYLQVATNGFTASIVVTDKNAKITFKGGNISKNVVQYNSTNKLFACYIEDTQKPVQLYKYTEKPKEEYKPGLTALELTVNDTHTITLPAIGEIPAPTKVTITSDNTEAVTVEGNEIKAVAAGKANIKVEWKETASWLAGNASFEVTVNAIPATVAFEQETLLLAVGNEAANVAAVTPEGAEIEYSSSNTEVATVSANGVVTAVAAGEATITASIKDTKVYTETSASYKVTVVAAEDVNKLEGNVQWEIARSPYGMLTLKYVVRLKNYNGEAVSVSMTVCDAKGVELPGLSYYDPATKKTVTYAEEENFAGLKADYSATGMWSAKGDALGTIAAPNKDNLKVKANAYVGDKQLLEKDVELESAGNTATGIEDVVVDGNDDAEYYTLQGLRVSEPQAGQLYIKRQGGKATKVLVK